MGQILVICEHVQEQTYLGRLSLVLQKQQQQQKNNPPKKTKTTQNPKEGEDVHFFGGELS